MKILKLFIVLFCTLPLMTTFSSCKFEPIPNQNNPETNYSASDSLASINRDLDTIVALLKNNELSSEFFNFDGRTYTFFLGKSSDGRTLQKISQLKLPSDQYVSYTLIDAHDPNLRITYIFYLIPDTIFVI